MIFEKADLELTRFDAAEYLDTPDAQSEYQSLAFETDDPSYIRRALATVARARRMSAVAARAIESSLDQCPTQSAVAARERDAKKTTKFDPADYLKSTNVHAELLSEAFETGDPTFIDHALDTVARARGMTVMRAMGQGDVEIPE